MDKKIREDVLKLMDIALAINGGEKRSQERTGNKPTVFVRFSGHVNDIEVDVYPQGYRENGFFYTFDVDLNNPYEEPDDWAKKTLHYRRLDVVIGFLEAINENAAGGTATNS